MGSSMQPYYSIDHVKMQNNDMNTREDRQCRTACDECRRKKLRCTGEQPACSRCVRKEFSCVYTPSKRLGRPKKRRPDDHIREAVPVTNYSMTNMHPDDWVEEIVNLELQPLSWPIDGEQNTVVDNIRSTPPYHGTIHGPLEKSCEASDISTHAYTNAMTAPTPVATIPALGCVCLDTMYLSLSTLQGMTSFRFPASLNILRGAISTAMGVLCCEQCPKQFITAVQNVQLLGTFVISVAERYARIVDAIQAEEVRANEAAETKSLCLSDPAADRAGNGSLEASNESEIFTIELASEEWQALAKKVVKSEFNGTNNGLRPGIATVLDQLEIRQMRWHADPPIQDFVVSSGRDRVVHMNAQDADDPSCLRLAREARRIIDHLKLD